MKAKTFIAACLLTFSCVTVKAQSEIQTVPKESTIADTFQAISGQVLDIDSHTPLPYANIYVLHKHEGAISNEAGHFTLDISGLENSDTLRFQYIGYKTHNITLGNLKASGNIYLQEEIFNLSEILVFGSNPDPKAIVKRVLDNKDRNYNASTCKKQVFIRERYIQDINEFKIKYKKSTIPELDRETLALVEKKFPKNLTSFTDFLGDLYFNENLKDSVTIKIDPVRTVSLKENDMADLKQMGAIFESVFSDIGADEYWKIRSGIFGNKIEMEDDEAINDSIKNNDGTKKDTLDDNKRSLKYYVRNVKHQLQYTTLDDKGQWEFLHKTGNYNYSLAGGTRVNGEDVYIIDFTPKSAGNYVGRMYVAINTFALIRADYAYAPGKIGRDFHLLGIGYTETQFSGSIYFEKKNDHYVLKYFTNKSGYKAGFDRSVVLLKKRKRFFIDKKLKELKVDFLTTITMNASVEYLVLIDQPISNSDFDAFGQKKNYEIIYVDQFDDKLWQGFSIIEPTKQMKEYKKQELNFGD